MLVEIKSREFRAKLLLAQKLAERGIRVYVGSRNAVMDVVAGRDGQVPGGVYYFKGGEPLSALLTARAACQFVVGQDEEIGPALGTQDVERAWRTRYPREVAALIDQVYAFAGDHVDGLERVHPDLARRALVTGWPRADLLQPALRVADERRAREIRSRLGEFVLFPSNFKINTEAQRRHAIAFARAASLADGGPSWGNTSEAAEYGSRAGHRLASFRRAAETLKDIAVGDGVRIVVRPHPSEDPSAWQDAVRGVPGLSVHAGGVVAPWLIASHAVIHAGCTTAVEAGLAGVSSGYLEFIGYQPRDFEDSASFRVSRTLRDLDEARGFVQDALDGTLVWDHASIPGEVLGPRDGLASDRIADAVAALDVRPEPPVARDRSVPLKRAAAVVVSGIRSVRPSPRFTGTNAQRKLPGGLHRAEAVAMMRDHPGAQVLTVSEPRFDLLEVEPA